MGQFARIQDGRVAEIIDFNPEGCFYPSLVWVEVIGEGTVNYGDLWDGQSFTTARPPTLTLEERRAAKLAALATKRYATETGGILVGGVHVRTDRASQDRLATAHITLASGFQTVIDWKGVDGVWRKLDATGAETLLRAVTAHVQSCFSRERELSMSIAAATTPEALEAIDINGGWPPNTDLQLL